MKVKELLEKLKNTDLEAEVYIKYPDFESDYNEYANIGKMTLSTSLDLVICTDDCWEEKDDKK